MYLKGPSHPQLLAREAFKALSTLDFLKRKTQSQNAGLKKFNKLAKKQLL